MTEVTGGLSVAQCGCWNALESSSPVPSITRRLLLWSSPPLLHRKLISVHLICILPNYAPAFSMLRYESVPQGKRYRCPCLAQRLVVWIWGCILPRLVRELSNMKAEQLSINIRMKTLRVASPSRTAHIWLCFLRKRLWPLWSSAQISKLILMDW